LTYIYGIGRTTAQNILDGLSISRTVKIETISEDDLDRIRGSIKGYLVEGDLRRLISGNIKRLKEIRCYRGIRHQKKLPVRGQNTKTNARTRK
jgi:small subunit ribosomal protein S13